MLLRLTALFRADEGGIAVDLRPIIMAMADEQRLEEELHLTAFLWEEAKHAEMFRRFFEEVAVDADDPARYRTPSHVRLLRDDLPEAMNRLRSDCSPEAQAEASVVYNMIVEGVIAETGYRAYHAALSRSGLLPGMQRAIGCLHRDENRRVDYGVSLLARLVVEHGDCVLEATLRRMNELWAPAVGAIGEVFAACPALPFGLQAREFTCYATSQFQRRVSKLASSR